MGFEPGTSRFACQQLATADHAFLCHESTCFSYSQMASRVKLDRRARLPQSPDRHRRLHLWPASYLFDPDTVQPPRTPRAVRHHPRSIPPPSLAALGSDGDGFHRAPTRSKPGAAGPAPARPPLGPPELLHSQSDGVWI